jgi:hypothetical protein
VIAIKDIQTSSGQQPLAQRIFKHHQASNHLHKDIQHHQAGNHLQRHSNIIRPATACTKDIQTSSGRQPLAQRHSTSSGWQPLAGPGKHSVHFHLPEDRRYRILACLTAGSGVEDRIAADFKKDIKESKEGLKGKRNNNSSKTLQPQNGRQILTCGQFP